MTARRIGGAVLLVVAAAGLVAWWTLAATAVLPDVVATLQLARLTFVYERELDDKPFLTGIDTRTTRATFDRLTAHPEQAWIGIPEHAGERPRAWQSVSVSGPLRISALPGGGVATFEGVRLNQLGMQPKTLVSAEPLSETAFKVTVSGNGSAATITFHRELVFECQHCRVGNGPAMDLVFVRLLASSYPTLTIEPSGDVLTLALVLPESREFERGLAFSEPMFVVNGGTLSAPQLRAGSIPLPKRATLDMASVDGVFRLTSLSLAPSGLHATVEARLSRLAVDGAMTTLNAWTQLPFAVRAALTAIGILSLCSGLWLVTDFRLANAAAAIPAALEAATSADIFVSYASRDREPARRLVEGLRNEGWRVWWDRDILAGKRYPQVIEAALHNAKCVIVLWSAASVKSHWVLTEASEGLSRGVLVPVLIETVAIPIEFRLIQTADLIEWSGTKSDASFRQLVAAVSALVPRRERDQALLDDLSGS